MIILMIVSNSGFDITQKILHKKHFKFEIGQSICIMDNIFSTKGYQNKKQKKTKKNPKNKQTNKQNNNNNNMKCTSAKRKKKKAGKILKPFSKMTLSFFFSANKKIQNKKQANKQTKQSKNKTKQNKKEKTGDFKCIMPPNLIIPRGLSTFYRCSLTTLSQDKGSCTLFRPYLNTAAGKSSWSFVRVYH